MRKSTCFALFTALVVALPSAHAVIITGADAPAGTVVVSGTFTGIPMGTVLDLYQITADSESAANLTAFELTFSGSFAQVQNASFGTNIASPLLADVAAFPPDGTTEDTHFVPNLTIPGSPEPPPTEGVITLGNPGTGFADDLISHKVAIAATDQAPSVLIAQILMMQGDTGSFFGDLAVAGNPDPFHVEGMIGGNDPNSGENTPPVVNDQMAIFPKGETSMYQLLGTDAEDGDDANLSWDWTGLSGPGAPAIAPTLSPSGLLTWDTTGSLRGFYTSTITATDSGGMMDDGLLTVQVPEPGVFVLAGMSLIGIVASRRRLS